jgi:hypothetical protein
VSLARHVVLPRTSQQGSPGAPSLPPVGGGMTRRGVVSRALATGAGAALSAAGGPGLVAAQDATSVSADEASTIETVSRQALYSLPRDHRWHGGPFYVSPIVPDQEILIPGLSAPLWEGALEVRWESSDGPLVGRMYMEEQFGVNDPELPLGGPLAPQLPLSGV